jgi:hypothetical protein
MGRRAKEKKSEMYPFSYRFYIPMPELTSDCDRVILFGLQTSDTTNFDALSYIRVIQMVLEIRILEDYCLSDIYIMDLAKYSLGHIPQFTIPFLKKFTLCAVVSIEDFMQYE